MQDENQIHQLNTDADTTKADEAVSSTEADVSIEEFEFTEDGEEDLRATLKKLRKEQKQLKAEKQEYLTNWQRERADFMNYKKDEEVRRKDAMRLMQEKITTELLPIMDSYDMAFANKEAWEKVDKNWRVGVEYIHQQLLKVLADHGMQEIVVSVGDTFDPTVHQPMSMVQCSEQSKDHTIASIVQKGYRVGERIIRPARVTVFEFKD
jgi:molecular chaperone GrpE